MIEEILKACSNFFGLSMLFPIILVIFIIGLVLMVTFGLFLFISGIKRKWIELDRRGQTLKIIKIVVGSILLISALLLISIYIIGMIAFINRVGFYSHDTEEATTQILNLSQIIL